MNIRIRLAAMNSTTTLPVQIIASHPSRCHSGFFSACSMSCREGLVDMTQSSLEVDGAREGAIASKLCSCRAGLVVTVFMGDLATEHVVAPEGVAQDERDDEQRPDQHEALTLRRCGGVPD